MKTAEKLSALAACPVFAGVPADELALLAEIMGVERVAAGEALFEAGEPSDRICIVALGELDVLVGGSPEPVRRLGRGALLGEYGMFLGGARTAAVRGASDAVLLSLDYTRFRAFLLQSPRSALVLLATAVQRLVALERGPAPAGEDAP